VGYVISGSARLDLEGQTLNLKAGDSWLVPAGAMHQYTILEPFSAVEATAPPAEVHGREQKTEAQKPQVLFGRSTRQLREIYRQQQTTGMERDAA
jgi:glyoxylate utilization-related uncharacterized protein